LRWLCGTLCCIMTEECNAEWCVVFVSDAVTVVLYNTMKSLSEMEEIPASQVRHFTDFITFVLLRMKF